MGSEPGQDPSDVIRDRAARQIEAARDLGVREAVGDERRHLELASAQPRRALTGIGFRHASGLDGARQGCALLGGKLLRLPNRLLLKDETGALLEEEGVVG
jgi:hypothetical protein